MGARVVGIEADGGRVGDEGFFGSASIAEGDAEVVICLGEIGLQRDGPGEFGYRVVKAGELLQDGTEIEMGFGIVGLQFYRAAIGGDGGFLLAGGAEGVAEIEMGFGIARTQGDGSFRGEDCIVKAADVAEGGAEVVVGFDEFGIEFDCFGE